MIKEELIVKTTALPQSRVALELEIPSNTCKSCVNETINSISRSAKIPGFRLGKIPKQVLIQRIGITQLHASALEKIIDKIISENPKNVELYKSGKDKLFGFFVGQVMKSSGGKANPQLVNEILKKKLN